MGVGRRALRGRYVESEITAEDEELAEERSAVYDDKARRRRLSSGCGGVDQLVNPSHAFFDSTCPPQFPKIFAFLSKANQFINPRRLVPPKGRIAIVTDAGRDAMDAGSAADERC